MKRRAIVGEPPFVDQKVLTPRGKGKVINGERELNGTCLYEVKFDNGGSDWFESKEIQLRG